MRGVLAYRSRLPAPLANAAGTGTTNRIPSTAATRPPPHAWASGRPACRATSGAFAAARVSGRRRRFLDCLHPGQVDLPRVVDADLGVDGQPSAGLPVGGIQRLGVLGQQRAGVLRQAERRQHITADRFPRPALQEPGLRVAPLGPSPYPARRRTAGGLANHRHHKGAPVSGPGGSGLIGPGVREGWLS